MSEFGLSKSRIMDGLKCPKLLGSASTSPSACLRPGTQRIFAMGHAVGAARRRCTPRAYSSAARTRPAPAGPPRRARRDPRLLDADDGDLTLFEATFQHDGVLVRTDLFFREDESCRFTEVKGATSLKEHYLSDAAIQAWVVRGRGVPVERVHLRHLDNTFVYAGDGDYTGLFVDEDVTDRSSGCCRKVPRWVAQASEVLAGEMPDVPVGPHCWKPYECPLLDWCRECPDTEDGRQSPLRRPRGLPPRRPRPRPPAPGGGLPLHPRGPGEQL